MATQVKDEQVQLGEGPTPNPVSPAARHTSLNLSDRALTFAIAVALLGLAEVAARNEWVSNLVLPAPSAVWNAITDGFQRGIYGEHARSTLTATLGGFLIASLAAIAIAGVLASIPRLERVVLPFIIAFQTLPKVAVAPLIILWLGFDLTGKTFIVVVVCFFPILVNSLQGLKVREREQLELMRSLGASRFQLFRYIRVPNALPYVFAGLHIGIIFALIGAIVAEFVGSRSGLGYLLLQEKARFNVPGVFAILAILMVMGVAFHAVMQFLEDRVAFWAKDISVPAP